MQFNIERHVKKLKTNLCSVVNEAIVNSIQSNSSNIILKFSIEENDLLTGKEETITGLSISDNGDGFTAKNRTSFAEYGSPLKENLGCKGIGRLCFLALFQEVKILSKLVKERKVFETDFDFRFTAKSFKERELKENIDENQTTIQFNDIKKPCKETIELIYNNLYNNILHLLYLEKEKGRQIKITLIAKDQKEQICTSELPQFKTLDFEVYGKQDKNEKFTLYYSFNETKDPDGVINEFYCANYRAVCRFQDKGLEINPLPKQKIIFLLISEFLDKAVNNERNDFDIKPEMTDMLRPLCWHQINKVLQDNIKMVLYEQYPELETQNIKALNAIKEDYLHLIDYMPKDILGGLIGIESVIKNAKKEYANDKEKFRQECKGNNPDPEEMIRKASSLAGKELIEYVTTREKIIAQLESLNNQEEKKERQMHKLFMQMGVDNAGNDRIDLDKNNLWLIDDKFMNYCYVASDKKIKSILNNMCKQSDSKQEQDSKSVLEQRPDISIFFRQPSNNFNAVIIELKAFGANAKQKYDGLIQLRSDYAPAFKKENNLNSIWYYLITKIDNEFKQLLENDDYKALFSTQENIYFKYYEKAALYVFVLSSDSLIADAKARNKAFIDIVKKSNGLNNLD